ncbi:MAG: hypothetical protein FJW40_15390 [Acidobacteria bacterium]|nr:hypothetical protein [Acidobacteriota bacterium]
MPRSPREILFRLNQEAANVWMLLRPPALPKKIRGAAWSALPGLPEPAEAASGVAGTAFAESCVRIAEEILAHRFPLLGVTLETGPGIDWRKDYLSGKTSGADYWRRIPYLDFSRVGDHKVIWELNRHQHLVTLAMAYRITGRAEFLGEIAAQVESWLKANPMERGINWASALEVAFRAWSWIWVYHLAGGDLPDPVRGALRNGIYQHGCYLKPNLSFYFSANTHLLGEALVLSTIGALFPDFPGAARWRDHGAAVVREQMNRQVFPDGAYFEQSTYYHVYAVDMFAWLAVLAKQPDPYLEKLGRMADFLDALLGAGRAIPLIGDDDGGRWFHPHGDRDKFGRATLATCSVLLGRDSWRWWREDLNEQAVWWLPAASIAAAPPPAAPAPASRLFENTGLAVLAAGNVRITFDCGPFGASTAGHSHSDTLSITVSKGETALLTDAATYTYMADVEQRNWFRGSAAHNTLRIGGADQATPVNPFRWAQPPRVELLRWESDQAMDRVDAAVQYRGFRHRRLVVFQKPSLVVIFDEVEGPGNPSIDQFWHCGESVTQPGPECYRIGTSSCLALSYGSQVTVEEGGSHGWRSPAYGVKSAAPVILATRKENLPAMMATVIDLQGEGPLTVAVTPEKKVVVGGSRQCVVET